MNMREYWANEAAMMRDKSGVLGKEVLMPVGSNATPDPDVIIGDPIKYYYNERGLPIPIVEVNHAKKGYINIVEGVNKDGTLKISGDVILHCNRFCAFVSMNHLSFAQNLIRRSIVFKF